MKLEKIVIRVTIIIIVIVLAVYSFKFVDIAAQKLNIRLPIKPNPIYWKYPYDLFIYACLLMAFLLTCLFRKDVGTANKSLLAAFFLTLVIEKYNFGYSLYFVSIILKNTKDLEPYFRHCNPINIFPFMLRYPVLLMAWAIGISLIIAGKSKIDEARGRLATDGVYKYIRNPQYVGLFLILAGTFFFAPTPLLLLLLIVITYIYYHLALREEKKLESKFGSQYTEYKNRVPMY
ncbi:MAG: isoprenylcysteine carboxylmethyltransferase family protein [Candidatus Omnitrophica bacterium]|nr:isoprenylcysteine carboxylmethyltransferase family protein [Candidatus Omnitrophota bacterium]